MQSIQVFVTQALLTAYIVGAGVTVGYLLITGQLFG